MTRWNTPAAGLLVAALAVGAGRPATRPAAGPAGRVLRVAIYTDGGAPDVDKPGRLSGPTNVTHCLDKLHPDRYVIEKINGADVRGGALDRFDVAVFPGGSGSGQARSLRAAGRDQVRAFVRRGGGFLGICGGAYLGSSGYDWSLNILNANVIDRQHWNRGDPTPVKLELTPLGRQQLADRRPEVTCIYHQGPLLGPATRPDLPAYRPLATFGSEVTQRAPKGVMVGTTAIAQAEFGRGHVILISPHPERSEGLDGFIRASVDWLGQGPAAVSVTAPEAGVTTRPSAAPPTTAPADGG